MAESLSQNFNHLKIHTQYSICEGAIKIDDLQEYSKNNKITCTPVFMLCFDVLYFIDFIAICSRDGGKR